MAYACSNLWLTLKYGLGGFRMIHCAFKLRFNAMQAHSLFIMRENSASIKSHLFFLQKRGLIFLRPLASFAAFPHLPV